MSNRAFAAATDRYAACGVDAEAALTALDAVSISLHCWQGDDVAGFEGAGSVADGGLAVTGNHPGRARNGDELRADLETALSLVPGRHRVNLHAIYAEPAGASADRTALEPAHFSRWIDWAVERGLGLDMNPTFFAHENATGGFTLAHPDPDRRRYWIEHGRACRRIASAMGAATGSPGVTNVWIPDGMKDTPADRAGPRELLLASLDEVFSEELPHVLDAVESKLFGIGTEAYVVGSHEFYLGYAIRRGILLTLDTGHFHPTESVADKLSAVLLHLDRVLLHVSRGLRWDSDHVVTLTDELTALAREIVHGGYLDRVHHALDYFDASIHRVAAWVIGMRSYQKALLTALLDPIDELRQLEIAGDLTGRLALMEEAKALPWPAVWNEWCERQGVAPGIAWLDDVRAYERDVQSRRS